MVTYSYLPGRHFDLFTFEIKPSGQIDITGVYEALAHRRRATQSYVIYHCPDAGPHTEVFDDICEEAKKHGIGIIVAENPADPKTWDERVEPTRNNPDPEKLDEFIRTTLSEQTRSQLLKWFR
jgi:hypothetical protein